MADISYLITLGIGSPAGIPEILSSGLQFTAVVILYPTPDDRLITVPTENRMIQLEENRLIEVPAESRIMVV
jgi:hypothetical protein